MKTLNKLETAIALLFFASWFLFVLINRPLVVSIPSYFRSDNLINIGGLSAEIIFAIAISCGVFFIARTIRTKTYQVNNQFLDLFDYNPTPMAIVELTTNKFMAVNMAAVNCYGYSKDEFLKLLITDIGTGDATDFQKNGVLHAGHISKASVRQHKKKNGEIITTELAYSGITFKNRKCVMLLANNITEVVKAREDKRIAEEEISRQQAFTSYVLENFPVDVAIFDKDHKYILLNKTAVKNAEMRNWMIGKDDFEYFRRKGTDMSMAHKRRERFLQAVAGKSTEWIDEHIVDGKVKYILRNFLPYKEGGELKYVYGYGMDITELRKAEMQKEEHLQQLEKIAFSTSHKIRQPICNLKGLIALLQAEETNKQEVLELINNMNKSVDIMDEYTRELGTKLHEFKQNLSHATS